MKKFKFPTIILSTVLLFNSHIASAGGLFDGLQQIGNATGQALNSVAKTTGVLFGPEIGHLTRESFNLMTLGEVGRAEDHRRAEEAERESQTVVRIEDAKVNQRMNDLKQLINDQYQAYLLTKDNENLSLQAQTQLRQTVKDLKGIIHNFSEFETLVQKIQDDNSSELEFLAKSDEYSKKLADALSDFSANADQSKLLTLYSRTIDRARQYRMSTQKFIGLMVANSALKNHQSQSSLSASLFEVDKNLSVLQSQIDAVVNGQVKQANVHLNNMRVYMKELNNLKQAHCGQQAGLPPCDLYNSSPK